MGGLAMLQCELHGTTSAQQCLDIIAEYAAANPDLEWIVGGGWSMEFFAGGTPTRQALDAVVPDRPVFLTNRDGHGNWVNTEGARAGRHRRRHAGSRRRPDRARGGRPPERAHCTKAPVTSSGDCCPANSDEDMYAGLLAAQELLFSLGHHGLAGRRGRAAVRPRRHLPGLHEGCQLRATSRRA